MLRRTARPFLLCLIVFPCAAAARADGIRLANFKDDETIRYPVAILQGTLDDKNARTITVVNQSAKPPAKELKGIVHKDRFKALAELLPGPNKLLLRSGTKELTLTLHYKPQTNPYVVQVIYMTDRKGDTKYQTQKQNDPQNYRAKLDTVMKLLQSYTAERMNELGYGRLTFNLEFDKDGKLDVHTFAAEEPAQFFYPLDDVPLFLAVRGQAEKKYHDPHTKRAVFTGFSRFDPASGKIRANTGRGGGGTAVCGTAGMWAWPGSLAEVFPAFADRTPVNTRLVADDSDGRSTVWGVNGTYTAVMLHELMHTWGLPHSKDTYDVIANRGFRNINRFFSFVEPPSKANPRFFEPPDNQATYIAPMSGSSLKNSRWFALDDKPWKDGGAPRITASGTEGDILIESDHGLGYLGFDAKDEAVGHKSWGFGDREPPRRYVLTAAELKELAGTTDVRIRAVDLQGQQSEAETKKLGGK
jgi:hypothetical protein